MTLLNAPEYDEKKEARKHSILIASGTLLVVLILVALAGFFTGHGWFFENLPVEHHVSVFLEDCQHGDYSTAYGIWLNDPNWQQHPQKYDYTLKRFTEDWTTASDWGGPVTSFHVDVSKRDNTGVVVAATINHKKRLFLKYEKSDHTLSYFPLVLSY
jgi:hypothetical protein